jgi:hypothetical protein
VMNKAVKGDALKVADHAQPADIPTACKGLAAAAAFGLQRVILR